MTGRQLICRLLWWTGVTAAARCALAQGGRFVVEFHGVAARSHAGFPAAARAPFTVSDLKATLGWIADRFRLLTPSELLAGDSGVLLTFDDGFANNCTNALPVLDAFDAPAVFFVTTQHVREPRDWLSATREQVRSLWGREDLVPEPIARDLFDGMSRRQLRSCAEHPRLIIGSHTRHHPMLTRCDDITLAEEIVQSKALLEQWTGRSVDLFAYPAGDYDARVACAVRDAGFTAAFAEDSRKVGLPRYEIPRIGLYESCAPYLATKLSGLHRRALPARRIVDAPIQGR